MTAGTVVIAAQPPVPHRVSPMSRAFSIYLDAVRFLAALIVFLAHAATVSAIPLGFPGTQWLTLAQDAVTSFFVLSGLVICHAVHHRDRDIAIYIINRLARLYSVVVPALLLTVFFYLIGSAVAPEHYVEYALTPLGLGWISSLFFVNQLWFFNLWPLSNQPFWSLGFEVWYYILFGCAFFSRGWVRIALVALAAAAMGPKILILLPVWLLGAALYRTRITARGAIGAVLFFGSAAAYVFFRLSGFGLPLALAGQRLLPAMPFGWAKGYASDYVVALLIAANFIGFRIVEQHWEPLFARLEKPIRWLASYTFSLYLFHVPLLIFIGIFLPKGSPLLLPIVLSVTIALGTVTERRKAVLREALRRLIDALAGRRIADDIPAPLAAGQRLSREMSKPATD